MEQGPGQESPAEMSLRPFWSFVEILGIVAVIAPFAISVSSSSMSTVNGQVTQFIYRDWLAVGGGILGAICGLGAATRFRTTEASKRALRVAVVLGLLGLGTFQILRGFGVTQPKPDGGSFQSDPAYDAFQRETMERARHLSDVDAGAAAAAKPPIDLAPFVKSVVDSWQNHGIHEMYVHATPGFRRNATEDELTLLFERITAAVGACALAGPITYAPDDQTWSAATELACAKTKLEFQLNFQIDKGTAMLHAFNVQTTPRIKPDAADATKLVRMILDDLLAAKIEHFNDAFDPSVLKKITDPASVHTQLAKIAAESGQIGEIREVSSTADGENKHSFVYDVAAEKQHLTATFTTVFSLTRWFLTEFNIAPVEAKKP